VAIKRRGRKVPVIPVSLKIVFRIKANSNSLSAKCHGI
jgi:hypothetical protein